MVKKIMVKKIVLLLTLSVTFMTTNIYAQSNLSLGVILNGSGWSGDNGPGNSDFESDAGGQFGLNVNYSRDRFYVGLSLQGGEYRFDNTGPTQFTSSGEIATSNVRVEHSDVDLLAGYYFWQRISLFIDLKTVSSEWLNNNYKQSFSGLGFGVSAFHPLNNKWTLFGSLGFVGGTIEQGDSTNLGDAGSAALSIGANFSMTKNDYLNMGLKFRNYLYDYDDGNEQEYSLNGIFVGYNHVFSF